MPRSSSSKRIRYRTELGANCGDFGDDRAPRFTSHSQVSGPLDSGIDDPTVFLFFIACVHVDPNTSYLPEHVLSVSPPIDLLSLLCCSFRLRPRTTQKGIARAPKALKMRSHKKIPSSPFAAASPATSELDTREDVGAVVGVVVSIPASLRLLSNLLFGVLCRTWQHVSA